LQGLRLVKASETDSGKALGEATVKRLTGGDKITACKKYGHNFTFDPTHKLFLLTNHKPEIKDTTHAIWRRVHLIPFNATFRPGQDSTLEEDLKAEASGVLNWLIEGCIKWQDAGLKPPRAVLEATKEYRSEMDIMQRFLEDCCTVFDDGVTGRVEPGKIFEVYKQWCKDQNENQETQTKFGRRLREKGFNKKKSSGKWYYTGIAIKAEEQPEKIF